MTAAAAILWWSWLAAAEKQNIVYWSRPRKEFTCRVDFTLKISLTRDDCRYPPPLSLFASLICTPFHGGNRADDECDLSADRR